MARSVTLQTILDRARTHADMRSTSFIDDTVGLRMINDVWPRLYDELVCADENYYSSTNSFSISSATTSYSLPADFYKLVGVDYSSDGGTTYFTLYPFNEGERNTGFTVSSLPTGTIRIRYVPTPTTYTLLSQSIDGIAGWDRLLSLLLAVDMLDAEESNSDRMYRKYQEELARVKYMSQRDVGNPGTITDIYKSNFDGQYSWLKYRLYGNNIEFMSTQFLTGAVFG